MVMAFGRFTIALISRCGVKRSLQSIHEMLRLPDFGAAFCSSLIRIDSSERKLTPLQHTSIGAVAFAGGWVLVVIFGWMAQRRSAV